jgi:predicted permease
MLTNGPFGASAKMNAMLPSLIDLRSALRMLSKRPGFAATVVLTLALGIGASSSIFSIINEAFLRPIPVVKEQDRLVSLSRTLDGRSVSGFDYPGYLDYAARSHCFADLIAYRGVGMNLAGGGGSPKHIRAMLVSHNYFSALGVPIVRGRSFLPEEDRTPGSHPVAVISNHLWEKRFGSDPDLVGKSLLLNGQSFTVVGIAPEGFAGLELGEIDDVWIPFMMEGTARPLFPVLNRGLFATASIVGCLKPGISAKQAQAEMTVLAHSLEDVNRFTKEQMTVRVSPNIRFGDPEYRDEAKRMLALLMTAAAVLLLIACANVANLMLAWASGKRKETAVRLALGANQIHLIRHFLTMSIILALLGGVAAIFIGIALTHLPQIYLGSKFDFSPDIRVLAFAFSISILTGIIVGLAPAMQGYRNDLIQDLKDVDLSSGFRRPRLRSILVILQVAMSLVLISGAGLLVRTIRNLQSIDLGFETHRLITFPFNLRLQGYPEPRIRQMQNELIERLKALPGVQSVSMANEKPVRGMFSDTDEILPEGHENPLLGKHIKIDSNKVAPNFFETLGVPIVSGRGFTDMDKPISPPVAIISESLERRYWPGENPIGKQFRIARFMSWSQYHQIVGIVKDTRYDRIGQKPTPHFYVPLSQNFQSDVVVCVRASADPNRLRETVRRLVSAIDPSLPPPPINTLAEQLIESDSYQRMMAAVVSLFGFLALALTSTGVYALSSYSVAQRSREIGIRMALGAERWKVLRLVMGRVLIMALMGIAIGLLTAFFLGRLIASLLYGISPLDPLNLAVASALMMAAAAAAGYVPARRAMRISLSAALRHE